MTIGRR